MPILIGNLTNPGADPVDGDKIRITYPSGAIEIKTYYAPVDPDPVMIRVIPTHEFLDRFTDDELSLIWRLAQTNDKIHGWTIWLGRQAIVNLDAARITTPLQMGVTAGKITQERMNAILA